MLGHRRSHKNPGQEGGRATAREAHCPSAEAQTSDHTNDIASRRSVAAVVVVGESAWPATTTIGSSFCQASYIVRRRPRSLGIPGSPSSIPTRARLQEALQICWRETSFHRFTKEQNLICRTYTLGNWHCTDRQILPWRQSGGTETLCGSPALPPSSLPPTGRARAGWGLEYRSKCLERSPSPERRMKKRDRGRRVREQTGWISNFIVFSSLFLRPPP